MKIASQLTFIDSW